ncbi:COG1361 S-layer family protein [uncultured Methanolobus sp.]|uniref:COG1361 S-layer family protein n=1 Tax=uncultured Methanolobus sp. TaxID=218300 RepID=UPI0029C94E50|nr:COG1361 S-layer family protein [uncultured Methanolobus sp.]
MKVNNVIQRSIYILVCVAMLSASFMAPVSAASAATMKVNIIEYDPFPAQIGEYVDVSVKIENVGYGRADAVSLKIEPEYPFSLDSQNNAVEFIGILSPEDAAVHEYRLYVDENAKVGTGTVDIYYQIYVGGSWYKSSFDLNVGSSTFDSKGTIELTDITCDPVVFMPGDIGAVSFTLTNTATESSVTIDDVDYDTNARVQSAALNGVEGIDVTSDNYIGSGVVGAGDSLTLSYNVEIADDVRDGTYYLDLSMVGNSHTYNNNWRIPVKVDSASIKVIPSKPMDLINGEGTLEFDVANMHPNTLSSVSVKLSADGVDFSPEEYFVGSMDSDELFTIEVDAKTDIQELSVPVTITVDYRNGINEHSTEVAVRELELAMEEEGNSGNLATAGIGLAILLGIPAVVFIKRRKQNN